MVLVVLFVVVAQVFILLECATVFKFVCAVFAAKLKAQLANIHGKHTDKLTDRAHRDEWGQARSYRNSISLTQAIYWVNLM